MNFSKLHCEKLYDKNSLVLESPEGLTMIEPDGQKIL